MGKCEGAGNGAVGGGAASEGAGSPRGADVASPRGSGSAEFSWSVPPEAPVFRPTAQEFRDPLAYISKIRPIAEKCGICKIKPPENWQPPFAVDVDRLRFTPRIQRLNELEAITRVKLNFLDQIVKFWELQGSVLKIPIVEKKPLDLYSLHKIVKEAGGFDVCTSERKWSKIASRLGHPQGKGVGTILKNHYERILYPYDVFKDGGATEVKLEAGETTPEKAGGAATTRSRSATKLPPAASPDTKPTRRWNKLNLAQSEQETEHEGSQTEGALAGADDVKDSKRLTPCKDTDTENRRCLRESPSKRWSGGMASACGSRPTRSSRALREHRRSNMTVSVTPAPEPAGAPSPHDPLAKYMCHNCGRGDVEEQMLLCDGCDDSYHTFCLLPPLADVPKGDWRCPICIAQEVSKPTEAFGFEQARREYTLQQFGEMADQFKSEYFNMPVHMVPTATVEKEFWRIVSSIDEDVTVEYGADLHSMDHGSGFPTKASSNMYAGDQEYAESSWNLNNLPVLEGSVLGHINADISGMKIPWMYVGMCFATFCWHNEDHWSYSINYLHWGEPKTWYGVPGSKAEQFEQTMKSAAPELFQWQPDLLHQLVTIMNPNILMTAGVPVYRTDQNAGEFVITFPRAYHAGFNQGYNFAEAVNFTPADWLKAGRECIAHYSNLRRYCVFSHDELVCKMAVEADTLGLTVALATYQDMRQMLHDERKLRKSLLEWGVTEAERDALELLPDDARQCQLCKTTCFLSAVACACTPHIVCLRHYTALCGCPPAVHKLRYRYTLDELPAMLDKLKRKSEAFREWADAVQNALDPDTPKSCDLDGLKAHCKRAHELKLHKTELMRALETAIEDAEKCASVIQQLDLNKMRTRTRHRDTQHEPKYRLSVEELTLFCVEIDGLACVLPEGSAVKEVLRQTVEFERRSEALLGGGEVGAGGAAELRELEAVVELGAQLCIQLPRLPQLQARRQQVKFLEEVRAYREDYAQLTPETVARLLEAGGRVPPHSEVEAQLAYLTQLAMQIEDWEKRARAVLLTPSQRSAAPASGGEEAAAAATAEGAAAGASGGGAAPQTSLAELDSLLAEAEELEACLPSRHTLATAVHHARDWLAKVEEMQGRESYPYYHTLEGIVRKSQSIPLCIYEKDMLAQALESAREWKQVTAATFLKKSWPYSLMEALSPRTDVLGGGGSGAGARRGRARHAAAAGAEPPPSSLEAGLFLRNFSEESTPTEIVAAFKQAEDREMNNMRELRARNMRKDVRATPQPNVTFCVCQKRQFGLMTQCELCKDWFHASCVAASAESPGASPARAESPPPALPFPQREPKFLCPDCTRTKRPRLERILGLLVWLQRLPVRLPEGEALQCVTERAMAWQDAARSALAAPHLAAALASHAHHHQASREKSDKLNAELKKATGRAGDHNSHRTSAASEHAYSASPRSPPAARLPQHMLHKLDELMMEGDLLELTLDETAHVWNVVCAARGPGGGTATAGRGGGGTGGAADAAPAAAGGRRAPHDAAAARLKRRQPRARSHHSMKRTRHVRDPAAQHGHMRAQTSGGGTGKTGKRGGGAARGTHASSVATTTNYLNRKQGVSSGSGLMMRKHYMARQERRKRSLAVARPKPQRGARRGGAGRAAAGATAARARGDAADADSSTEDSSNDDDEDCAAPLCLRPTGNVHWVQCDGGCDQWFHLHCVGLVKNSLKEDEDYYCTGCSDRRPTRAAPPAAMLSPLP